MKNKLDLIFPKEEWLPRDTHILKALATISLTNRIHNHSSMVESDSASKTLKFDSYS